MIVEKSRVGGMTLLTVEGIIKLGESAKFLVENLQRVLESEEGHVILDLARINHIDSTGIGELVGYLGQFRTRDRKLILAAPSERIEKLLAVSQLDRLFTVYPTVAAAVAAESDGRSAERSPQEER